MMVVLGIIGAIIALGLSRVKKKENDIKKTARDFYVLGKEIRNQARLKNATFRLMIRLDEGAQSYWVESAQGFQGRIDDKEKEELAKLNEDERPREVFEKDSSVLKKEKTLPSGLFFKSVENLDQPPLTVGTGTIYFFPNGFVETTALQITDRKKVTWTLIYQPLTGQADIIPEERSLRDSKRD
jgi:general secretion pathway protein H